MPDAQTSIEALLKRDRTITLAGLILLCALAWVYVLMGAGLGMSPAQMVAFSLFPHLRPATVPMPDMPGMDMGARGGMAPLRNAWSPATWAQIIAMWWVMMVAMMTPSAAPTVLLYARVFRNSQAPLEPAAKPAPTGAFLAGYLLVWLAFSIAATAGQWLLGRAGLISEMLMSSQSRWLSSALLLVAGVYQFSPLKRSCLSLCRSPTSFLTRHWRPGSAGALRLGMLHGAYCVGCCAVLMALLFVGGVMNLVWIALLAVLILLEKTIRSGRLASYSVGVVLIGWAIATLMV